MSQRNPFRRTGLTLQEPDGSAFSLRSFDMTLSPIHSRRIRPASSRLARAALACALLSGCDYITLDPKGPVAANETLLFYNALAIMTAIGAPVIAAVFVVAYWFRKGGRGTFYLPDWHYSGKIELVVWSVPALTVFFLGALAVVGSNRLDPRAAIAAEAKPLDVQVVALDWKWLFLYPEAGVASINELALPIDTPIHFRLTSATVMNSFFIPNLGSQIYAMGAMETRLNLLAHEPGDYLGLSAQLSGAHFTDMRFTARAMSADDFAAWIAQARQNPDKLDRDAYAALLKPAPDRPRIFGAVEPKLFDAIVARTAPTPENAAACAPAPRRATQDASAGKGT